MPKFIIFSFFSVELFDTIILYIGNGGDVTLDKVTYSNTGSSGYGVFVDGGECTITGGTFTNNRGSGVMAYSGTCNITGGMFTNNNYGVMAYSGTCNITGGMFTNNSGLGVYVLGGECTITGGTFGDDGDIVYVLGGITVVGKDVKIPRLHLLDGVYITLGTGVNAPTTGMDVNVSLLWSRSDNVIVQSGATDIMTQYIKAYDTAKMVEHENGVLKLVDADTTPPTIPVLSTKGETTGNVDVEWYGERVRVTASSTDDKSGIDKYEYEVDGVTSISITGDRFVDGVSGQNTLIAVRARAYDRANNISEYSDPVTIKIDLKAPTRPILRKIGADSSIAGKAWYSEDVYIEVGGSIDTGSGLSHYEYKRDSSGAWEQVSSADGMRVLVTQTSVIYVRAIDLVGNISDEAEVTVSIDKIAPDAPTYACDKELGDDIWYNVNITVYLSAGTDFGGSGTKGTQYSLDGGENWLSYTDGVLCGKSVMIWAITEDNAGNWSEVLKIPVNIDKAKPKTTFENAA